MAGLFNFLFIISLISVVVWCISRLLYNKGNTPTWNGIIISAILGMLPCYLILCFFGIMGEKQQVDETKAQTMTYTEEMRRRYDYNNPRKKNRNGYKYAFVGLLIIFIFYLLNEDSEKPSVIEPVEIQIIDTIITEIPEILEIQEEIVKPVKKTTAKRSHTTQSAAPIEEKNEITVETNKSTLEILEERQHAEVVKQAKEAGVSTEGTTLEILERIFRKTLESH